MSFYCAKLCRSRRRGHIAEKDTCVKMKANLIACALVLAHVCKSLLQTCARLVAAAMLPQGKDTLVAR